MSISMMLSNHLEYCIQFQEEFCILQNIFFCCIFYMQYMKLNYSMLELFEYFRSKSQA